MANLSYSFHVSNSKNAIKNASDLGRADSHNSRNYDNYSEWKQEQNIANEYTKDDNIFLVGGENLYKSVQDMYKKEFGEALKDYNAKQTREDRKIKDYFNHISKSENQHLATEIIVQVGSKEDWENLDLSERQKMTPVFRGQVQEFQQRNPNFKICQAVIHYDESSPHLHIVGVPIGEGKKRGLARRVQKSAVFSQKNMYAMQDYMRERAERDCQKYISPYISFKDKQKGRGHDYRKEELKALDDNIARGKENLKVVESKYKELYKILATEERKRQKIKSLKPVGIQLQEDNYLDRIAKKIYKQNNAKVNARDLYNFLQNHNEIEKVNAGFKENIKSLKSDINVLKEEKTYLEDKLNELEKQDLEREVKSRAELEKSVRQELSDKIEAVVRENEYIKSAYRPEVMDLFAKENKSLKAENKALKSQNEELLGDLNIAKDKQKELNKQLRKYKNKNREDDFLSL
jgi:hypothetical protein